MPQPDTLLEGKYEIVSKLREGGMGTIYLVRHRLLDRIRVIKVMRPHASADPDLRRRFLDEARTATRLNHPNLCTIHDFAIDEDATAYLVMEFIEGVNVAELIGLQGSPGIPMSLEIAHQALLALGYLHRQNVVHRDVAPDNLMVSKTEDGRPLVKVIDLGIAKAADRPTEMTATGVFLGKLRYASPELAGSLGPAEKLDGRSDLYSLGIVLYELLTGARPFSGNSPAELLRGQLFNPPLPFAQSDPNGRVPTALRAAVLKALEKKREDRYASAEEFDQAILAIQSLATPADIESTRALLSEIPAILLASSGPVTPSAQSRIDHQFAPGTTPLPATPHLTMAPTVSATPTPPPAQRPPASSQPPESSRRAPWVLVVIATAVAAASVLLLRQRSAPPTAETRDTAFRVSPAAVAAPAATSTQPPPVPSVAPSPEPVATLAPQPEAAAAEPPARRAASVVKPTRFAENGARRAASPAAQALRVPPTPVLEAAEAPRPVIPTPPEKPSVPVVAPPTPKEATESDRIRDAIRRYEKAQNTLDAELYARIFPSVDRERIARAFQSLASQSVEFEIRRVQIDPSGTQARVEGYEKRTAVPRAGTEQRVSGERVLVLEKRADGWVILRIN